LFRDNLKLKCRSPHEFLTSIVYSLSYAPPKRGSVLRQSLLEHGYIFTAMDMSFIYNKPAPDFLLVNKPQKIVLAVECKGNIISDNRTDKILRKFNDEVFNAINAIVHDNNGEFETEIVIHTFDIYAEDYVDVAEYIKSSLDMNVILWTTTASPQVIASPSTGEHEECYTLRKYLSSRYSANHKDNSLDKLLHGGIVIRENEIICNPLVDPDVEDSILFYEISDYLLRTALLDEYRGTSIQAIILTQKIKHDYQSPIPVGRIIKIIQCVFEVFPWLGTFKSSENRIIFKKKLSPKIEEFWDIRNKVLRMNKKEFWEYIRKIIEERSSRKS